MADTSRPGWLHQWGRTLLVSARWRLRQGHAPAAPRDVRREAGAPAPSADPRPDVPRPRTSWDEDRPLTVEQILTWSESDSRR